MSIFSISRRLAAFASSLLLVSLVLALGGAKPESEQPPVVAQVEKPPAITPLFGKTEPAANNPVLVLVPNERGVHGWVAGKMDTKDSEVHLKAGKDEPVSVRIGKDNTFLWEKTTKKNLTVTAEIAPPPDKGKALSARTTLVPTPTAGGPTAFFITDRSAYRPGHTVKFVAFLRELLPNGDFKPVGNREVTVDITSQTKGTRATQLKLNADAQGRIVGQYTFSEADALDHYTITANDFGGNATVLLGEYRKTKVGLKLLGKVIDGKLEVTFDARDYLDRPVKGTAASYSAVVTHTVEPAKLTLNPDEFAKPEGGPPGHEELEALPDDERLISMANGVSAMTFAGFGSRHVSSREGNVKVAADGTAKLTLDLHPDWLKGHHTITVSGVFTDDTGRENRSSKTFKLDLRRVVDVKVSIPKELFANGETIPVTLTPIGLKRGAEFATTLIVVKLEAQPATPWVTPQFNDSNEPDDILPDNTRLPPIATSSKKGPLAVEGWKSVPIFDPVKRKIVSVEAVVNNAASLTLKQPGAYKILAITKFPDGTAFESEVGVVVQPPAKMPGVVLQLDKREIDSGSRLTGAVHTRFAGAMMLLTLRDSQGVKLLKPITADQRGVARIDEALPANLRYGCAVTVQYPESANIVHADQRDLFVIPTDRTIKVTTTVPPEVGPGADIKLGVALDRQEEVDLVVSVFDESLLGVSGDLSGNIRNHFLADARGQGRAARDLAATRMGTVTVSQLVKKAETLLNDEAAMAKDPTLRLLLTSLVERWKEGKMSVAGVVTLIRLTGFEVYLAQEEFIRASQVWAVPKNSTLADLLRWERKENSEAERKYAISATVVGDVVLVALASRFGNEELSDPWAGHRGNRFTQFGGPLGFQGFNQFGFGAQFGIQGQFGFSGPMYGGLRNAGFGGGGLGIAGGPSSVAGFQGSFSHAVGGQMGMSHGFNRDFGLGGLGGVAPLPGLGISDELVRRDFADSAFWSVTLRTDKTGNVNATFKLPDSLTNWRVQVTAVSSKMHVGTGTAKFKSTRSVMIWPMLPRTFTEGDTVRVFGTVHNLTEKEETIRVHLKAENGQVLSDAEQTVKVPPKGSVPVYWNYKAGVPGFTDLLMSAKCDAGTDASLKKLPVTSGTVLERVTVSGFVGKGELKLTLPQDFDPTKATTTVTVAPTLAADLADTLPYLVDYPYGCVEQTMSRFLPALRVAHIMRQTGLSTVKELEAKLPKVVAAGQKRLIELQQPDGGWGWNGNSSTHEMMTPYALFGLLASEQAGYPCPNPNTIPSGMQRLEGYLNQMISAPDDNTAEGRQRRKGEINDAMFCLWVYSMKPTNRDTITRWWPVIERVVGTETLSDSGHAYALEIAVKYDMRELAVSLAAALKQRAKKAGDYTYWTSGGFSRWGDNTTEVTAIVMKALVANDPKDQLIPGILAFFHGTKRGDRWDSTKDTACVLYALCDYLAAVQAGPAATGLVKVAVNGTADGSMLLDKPMSKSVKLAGKTLKAGENVFTVDGPETSGGALARVVVSFTRGKGADIPARDHGVKVERTISVRSAEGKWTDLKSGATVPMGSYVKVRVAATPAPGTQVQYTLLESPKPAGGETVPADDPRFHKNADGVNEGYVLREDREAMTCFHYEHAQDGFTAEYVVLTEFAGEFRVAPARVELMYKPTVGGHSDSFVLKVEARK